MMWMIFNFLIINAILHTAKTDGNQSFYRYDYSYSKEAQGWLKLHRAPATFRDAFFRCNLEGAVVASPLNDKLYKVMVTKLADSDANCAIFTGIHATISKGDFTSIEGVPLAKIPAQWAPNEPDNFENQEDCMVMLQSGAMADTRCNETFPYMCYKKRTTIPLINECGTVDTGYKLDSRTGSCYKFHTIGRPWRRAQMTCLAEGGQLAVINSGTELMVLKEIFSKISSASIVNVNNYHKDNIMLGFLDVDKRGSWYTVNGQSLEETGYSSWSSGQPSNGQDHDGGQYCGSMFRSGLLDDVWCETVPFAYICEKTPDSLLSIDE